MACGMKDYTSHRGIGCYKCNHCVSSINAIHQGLGFLFFVKRIYSCREWKSDFKFFSSGMKGTDAVLMNQKWLPWGMKKLLGKRYFFFFFLWWQMVQILKYLFLQLYIVFQDNFAVSTPSVWVPFMQDPMETNPRLPEFKNYQCFSSQLIVLQWSSLILRFKQKIIWMTTA